MRLRRSGIAALVIVVLTLVGATFAASRPQQAAVETRQAPAVTFTSRANLVMVPTIVTTKNGQHLTGLKAEDFTVQENGKPVKVAVFEEIISSPKYTAPQPSNLPPGTFINETQTQTPKPLVVLALDLINTSFVDKAYARSQIINYLEKSLDGETMVALVTLTPSGVHVIHDFTEDPAVLIAELRRMRLGPGQAQDPVAEINRAQQRRDRLEERLGEGKAEDIFRADMQRIRDEMRNTTIATLECLKEIAQAYGGVPGRKALVWVTGGFPFSLSNTAMVARREEDKHMPDTEITLAAEYDQAWKRLNNANFSLYTVDARGLVNSLYSSSLTVEEDPTAGGKVSLAIRRALDRVNMESATHSASLATFHAFADMTGGKAFVNNNDLTSGFRAAVQDSSAYYMVGYYSNQKKPGWHKLKVNVRQKEARVRARSGYLIAKDISSAEEAELRRMDIRLALYSPMEFTSLPIRMRLVPSAVVAQAAPAGKKSLPFELDISTDALEKHGPEQEISLSVVGVAQDGAGNALANITNDLKTKLPAGLQKLNFEHKFDLAPGQHTLRLVVHDNFSGRTGSVIAPITVE